jgi:hypothetical protein
METHPEKLTIMIDIYRMKDISSQTVVNIGNNINQLFNTVKNVSQNQPQREVLIYDDVIGRQIKVNKNTYIIMLTSYKSLLTTEVINPWSWNKYWYGTTPTVKFIFCSGRAKEIKNISDFHFERSQMSHNPYLIITDIENSGKEEILQFFQNEGFSSNRIILISKNFVPKELYIMVKMIEAKLCHNG